ncbi:MULTISPECIES: 30S ribosomal protein S15 [unclassified Mycoplasma]|uniref:30S ribosomal protein S15 n=1 Tax=unclassified Mycoplasma TaxID=2683645 RepID=UPI000FDE1B5C
MVTKVAKADLVKKFGQRADNTGAPAVQIALLTSQIESLKEHFKTNPKDIHSKRGFLAKIEQRKKMLAYLKRTDLNLYQSTIKQLSLRK